YLENVLPLEKINSGISVENEPASAVRESTMKKRWIDQLIALVGGKKRTPIRQPRDWRGRPVAENAPGLTATVSLSKDALYATLCLPFDAEEKRPSGG